MADVDLSDHQVPQPSEDRCFLCGEQHPPHVLTREHVFPKWLQRRHQLFDQSIDLLNGSQINYRSLVVPACSVCNSIYLSRIENHVAQALRGGADAVRRLGHEQLYVWLAKLFFGTLYAEGLLPGRRERPADGPILPAEVVQGFQHLHFLMQAARTRLVFHGNETNYHSSILVLSTQQHPKPAGRFMYRDDVEHGCIAVRLDTVGLICVVDGGAQERLANEVMPAVLRHNLHPLQFEEICAKVFMKARTLTRTPKYITTFAPGLTTVTQLPLAGLSTRPVFDGWDQDIYGGLIATFVRMPLEVVAPGNGKVMTWIEDLNSPRFIDVRDFPWPPV